jgi:hypothetical protein
MNHSGGDPASPADIDEPSPGGPSRRSSLETVVRKLAAASAAGALLGVLVGGVGGRLAMALLAAQNPEDTGRLTSDEFRIGQFTVAGTIQLLASTLQLGLVAAMIYLVLRPLAFGPRWLRVASLTIGGTAVFGTVLISPDGPDFTILDPHWLPVVLFLAIPAVFIALLTLLADHWLAADSWFATASIRKLAAVLLVWIPAGVLIVLLGIAIGVGVAWREMAPRSRHWSSSGPMWAARATLGIIGIWALIELVSDIDAVT